MVVYLHRQADALWSNKELDDPSRYHLSTQINPEVYFWVGISIMLVGRTLDATGFLIQKYAHNTDAKKANATQWTCCGRSADLYFTSPTWLCGFGLYVLAHILVWASLAMAPATVLSSLMCWSTVITFVCAPIFLGEIVTVFRLLSVCVMIFGCFWVVMSGPRVYQVFTVEMLKEEMKNMLFQVISGLALLYLVVCACMLALSNTRPRLSALQYTVLAAVLGWYSVLSAKITSGLVFSSWHHTRNQFDEWESWVMLVTMIVLAVTNLHFLNMALSIGDAVYVVPVYEALAILGQTLLGGIFFQEFQHLDTYGHVNFWLGLTCILVGVICLSRKGPQTVFFQYPVISPTSGGTPRSGRSSGSNSPPAAMP